MKIGATIAKLLAMKDHQILQQEAASHRKKIGAKIMDTGHVIQLCPVLCLPGSFLEVSQPHCTHHECGVL